MTDTRREFMKKACGGFVITVGVGKIMPTPRSLLLSIADENPFVLEATIEKGEQIFYDNPKIELFENEQRIDFTAHFEADKVVTIIGSKLWFKGDIWMARFMGPLTLERGETVDLTQPIELAFDVPFGYNLLEYTKVSSQAVLAALEKL